MASIEQRLLQLKKEIDQAKLDKAAVEGRLQQNMERLKTEFGCRSLEQAQAKLNKMKEQKEELIEQIEKAMEELEGKYQW